MPGYQQNTVDWDFQSKLHEENLTKYFSFLLYQSSSDSFTKSASSS